MVGKVRLNFVKLVRVFLKAF